MHAAFLALLGAALGADAQWKSLAQVGDGRLDVGALQQVLDAGQLGCLRCQQGELLRSPDLSGKLVLEWTLDRSGKVTSVRVDPAKSTVSTPLTVRSSSLPAS